MSMSLSIPNNFLLQGKPHLRSIPSVSAASLDRGLKIVAEANSTNLCYDGSKERIKKMFDRVELSVSSYDTAWVAMVPSPSFPETPCFPECVNWLLDNQLNDGSWGLHYRHPLLIRDALSSTLACVLALRRWGVGEEQMNKGLHFIESNFASSADGKQHSPIGFDIIFPGMLEYAKELNLDLHLGSGVLDGMLHKRDSELKSSGSSSEGRNAYLAYFSEGIGKLQDWEMVMKYQRKNGSLFNSPSTTAAALIHRKNPGRLRYLRSLLNLFGNAVPTVYPLDIYARLCMVDNLVRLGIDRHFRKEIRTALEMTYRSWLQSEEELFSDITTCAMAFRILRLNGYDVSPDPLAQFLEEDHYIDSFRGNNMKDMNAAMELYKASEINIYTNESALEKTHAWSSNFLKQELCSESIHADTFTKKFRQEVDDALKLPHYANLERLENRRCIEHYNIDNTKILKTSFCSPNISNEDFLKLAVEDYNICQLIHREELKDLARWIVDNKLDQLKFARQKLAYCYFSAAATLFPPELKDSRISWAKNGVLTTVADDFFDVAGSEEELINLIELVEKWDVNVHTDYCCSDQVGIIFSALRSTICEIGDRAITWQGRSVTRHIVEIWLDFLKAMSREAEWTRNKLVPTMDEYMTNGYVSLALGPIVLPALYFVGPKLSEEVVRTTEFRNLLKLTSTSGRLLNDIRSFKKETGEGKLNAIALHMIHGTAGITEEEAVREVRSIIQSSTIELFRLVLQEKDSVVPRACKDLFWKMSKVLHFTYWKDDGFASDDLINVELINAVNEVLHEPIVLKEL